MKKIRAYIDWNDATRTHYYRDFEIVENLPKINEIYYEDESSVEKVKLIERVNLDCENSDDVYNYDYYEIIIDAYDKDYNEHDERSYFVCVELD